MSVDKYNPHILILPEDDDNRELAVGFVSSHWISVNNNRIQILPVAGGWASVLEKLKTTYIPYLRRFSEGHIVLLIDFDNKYADRIQQFRDEVPDDLTGRVFVIGVWDEPQDLRRALNFQKRLEEIGSDLADDCRNNKVEMWGHSDLKHNEPERIRLMLAVKSLLF